MRNRPLLASAAGHRGAEMPSLGVPCPTTIFTIGVLMWASAALPRTLFVIPMLWAVVGTAAVFSLGMWEDLRLTAAALVAASTLIANRRPRARPASA